jgi:O-antigen ligase
VIAVAAGLLATSFGDLVAGTTFGPFGYSNADAAFFTQAMVAAWMVACATRSGTGRWTAFGAGLLFALVPIAGGGRAVVVLFALALAAMFAGGRGIPTKAVAVVGAGLFVAGVLVTVVLGATFEGKVSGDVDQLVDATISTRRPELWHDALVLIGEHPLTGVGPGRWADESPAARADADADQAHNAFLQQGAETGVVGMALLLLVVLWAFVSLASNTAGGAYAALGVAALTAFGLHASIDYIFDFPAVVLTTAALVGAAGTGASIRGE